MLCNKPLQNSKTPFVRQLDTHHDKLYFAFMITSHFWLSAVSLFDLISHCFQLFISHHSSLSTLLVFLGSSLYKQLTGGTRVDALPIIIIIEKVCRSWWGSNLWLWNFDSCALSYCRVTICEFLRWGDHKNRTKHGIYQNVCLCL